MSAGMHGSPTDTSASGLLVVCATPIGNLDDASPRLAAALEQADATFAEDTRRARILLDRLGVSSELRSFFAGNERGRLPELRDRLEAGETVVLITDAGTPAISDPGFSAVRTALDAGARVSVVPGPSAVTAALAVSGLSADRFVFEGFLPRRGSNRARRLDDLARERRTMVLFSAPSRVGQDLADLGDALGSDRAVVVCRELTKLHEDIYRGTLSAAAENWSGEARARGEFTLVVAGGEAPAPDLASASRDVETLIRGGTALSEAVRTVARSFGVPRRALYEEVIRSRDGA